MNDLAGDETALARAVCAAMEARDRVFIAYGMRAVAVSAGRVTLEMTVRDDMLNGHDICHGGVVFAFADTAMAIASNAQNQTAVAAAAGIDFIDSARPGETLRAEAVERSARRRTAIYDVTVSGADGRVVALFRGRTQRIGGKAVADLPALGEGAD